MEEEEHPTVSLAWHLLSSAALNLALALSRAFCACSTCTDRPSRHRQAVCALLNAGLPFQHQLLNCGGDPTMIRGPFLEVVTPKPASCVTERGPVRRSFVVRDDSVDPSDRWLLYVHGGGFVAGDIRAYEPFCCALSQRLQCRVLYSEYRLAPEHRLPQLLEDVSECFQWLQSHARELCVVADSAGALLALELLLQEAKEAQEAQEAEEEAQAQGPRAPVRSAVLISPILDLTFSGESFWLEAPKDDCLTPEMTKQCLLAALPEGAEAEALSPLFRLEEGLTLPRLLLVSGWHEICRDDAVRAAARLRGCEDQEVLQMARDGDLGGECVLDLDLDGFHDYPLYHQEVPEAKEALDRIVAFVTACWP